MIKPSAELIGFLKPFPDEVVKTALELRDLIWSRYPDCNELIYDNYNALAIGWSLSDKASDAFCSIAVFGKYVRFGLNRGSELNDDKKIFEGKGSLYRSIKVDDLAELPKQYIKKLVKEAYINSKARLKNKKISSKGKSIVKLSLPVKRRPIP
jgi:hypothetical protein